MKNCVLIEKLNILRRKRLIELNNYICFYWKLKEIVIARPFVTPFISVKIIDNANTLFDICYYSSKRSLANAAIVPNHTFDVDFVVNAFSDSSYLYVNTTCIITTNTAKINWHSPTCLAGARSHRLIN